MSLWWPSADTGYHSAFPSQPWETWFSARRPVPDYPSPGYDRAGDVFADWPSPANALYWFSKIPATGTISVSDRVYNSDSIHATYVTDKRVRPNEQLAFKSPVTRSVVRGTKTYTFEKDRIYILTYDNDSPRWGNNSTIQISPPCGNWYSDLYYSTESTRSQTMGILAGVRGERDKTAQILAAIAKIDSLDVGILATVRGTPELDIAIRAAVLGEATRYLPTRAAIRAERLLTPAIIAAVGKNFDALPGITATVQGNPQTHGHLKAAILGEAEKSAGIIAYVVKTRVNSILLEMENLFPQELDLRSTPNSASKVKDYRKSSLSARDS
jgi:hypothetical protein